MAGNDKKYAIVLSPLVKEEIETSLTIPGTKRGDAAAVRELLQAVRSPNDKLLLSAPAVKVLLNEVRQALKMLNDPYLGKESSLAYHKMAMKKAFDDLAPLSLLVASRIVPVGPVSAGLLSAALTITAGKCPEDGCVVKRAGAWRVVSNKTGKLWPQTYKTKGDAQDAIAAYHVRRSPAAA